MTYTPGHNPYSATDTPDYDDWLPFDTKWTATDWIIWHKALVDKYGKSSANDRWKSAWDKTGGVSSAVNDETEFLTDRSFVEYFLNQGIVFSDVRGEAAASLMKIYDSLRSTGENVFGSAENFSKAIKGGTKNASFLATYGPWILLGAGVLALVGLIWFLVKNADKIFEAQKASMAVAGSAAVTAAKMGVI